MAFPSIPPSNSRLIRPFLAEFLPTSMTAIGWFLGIIALLSNPSTVLTAETSAMKNPFAGNAAAIKEGTELFRGLCSGCHGGTGRGGKCPDLTDDIWIHGDQDADLLHVISKGVSGTEMRNFDGGLKQEEIWKLIAYIRSIAAVGGAGAWKPYEDGSPKHGRELFFDPRGMAQCARCHMINGEGGRLGPDLSRIAAKRTPEYIWESIINPNADIVEGYRQFVITTTDGNEYEGYLKNEDNFSIQMFTTAEKMVSLDKMEVMNVTTNKGSAMFGNFEQLLSKRDLHDIMSFLKTLTGKNVK